MLEREKTYDVVAGPDRWKIAKAVADWHLSDSRMLTFKLKVPVKQSLAPHAKSGSETTEMLYLNLFAIEPQAEGIWLIKSKFCENDTMPVIARILYNSKDMKLTYFPKEEDCKQ